jgi:ribosomal-protein-alanine N-acetyltransferase
MELLPIHIDELKNQRFRKYPECVEVLDIYPGYYQMIGFNEPWIGYFVSLDGEIFVGAGGFKGKPIDGKVEIAYATFESHRRKGIGTQICHELVKLVLATNPSLRITARTLKDGTASMKILEKNGFTCLGTVIDPEDGEVLEWQYRSPQGS